MAKKPNAFALLTLEGYLFHSALTQGLSALRAAHNGNKGAFYTAFFQLAIGLERVMKVIILIDHMARNALALPTDNFLKKQGHDLTSIFAHIQEFPDPTPNPLAVIKAGSLPFRILEFLSEFARRTRYYNLDTLVSAKTTVDPLKAWHKIIDAIFAEDLKGWQRERIATQAAGIAEALEHVLVVDGRNLDGSQMDVVSAALYGPVHDLTARYAVFHAIQIIQALRELLDNRVDAVYSTARSTRRKGAPIPLMTEFLDFIHRDRKAILAKKKWP
jgi:hypothetical protein